MEKMRPRLNLKVCIGLATLMALFVSGLSGALWAEDEDGTDAEVNGARLWYGIQGSGEALILLPGGPGLSYVYFIPHFAELSENFRVIYHDPFGRGMSDRAEHPTDYTLKRDVDDLEALRKVLNLERLNIFGHSYGGIVAQGYVLKYPEHVDKLILANGRPPLFVPV